MPEIGIALVALIDPGGTPSQTHMGQNRLVIEVRCRPRLRNEITIRTPLVYRGYIDLVRWLLGCCRGPFGTVRGGSVEVGAEE